MGLLAAYAGWAARSTRPRVVDVRLFRDRAFAASASASLLHHFVFAAAFLVPLYLQTAGGLSALQAGWIFAAQGVGTLVAVLPAGWLADVSRNARLPVLAGLALVAAGTLPFALAPAPSDLTLMLVAALFVRGVGLAFVGTPLMASLYQSLPDAQVPAATTANAMGLQFGGAAGTAMTAVVLGWFAVSGTWSSGYRPAFWVTLVVVALTVVPVLFLPARGPAGRAPDLDRNPKGAVEGVL